MIDVQHGARLSAGTPAPEFGLPSGPDLSPIDLNLGADGILPALADLTGREAPA